MPKYDVLNEAVMDAPPSVVYKAILDEFAGVTDWWKPVEEFKLKGDTPVDRVGALVDMVGHSHGITNRVVFKMTKFAEAKSIEYEMAGDFVGTGRWTFEPTADGKTKVKFRWNADVKRPIVVLLSHFMSVEKAVSEGVQQGFKACNSYLNKK